MSAYLISLLTGILIGVIYHFLGVRSPAPPIIALLGLLGMVIGESGAPYVKDKFFPPKTNAFMEKNNER